MLARTIIEEIAVSEAIDAASKEYPRITEIFDALKWRLARRPDDPGASQIAGIEGVWLIKSASWSMTRGAVITAMYTYSHEIVNIYAVKITPLNG